MSLFVALIIGIAAGACVDFLIHGTFYNLFLNGLVGVIGSIIGLVFFYIFLRSTQVSLGIFNVPSALCSAIGAIALALFVDGLQNIAPKRVSQSHVEEDPLDEE